MWGAATRLAGDGDFADAIAGKPDSYRDRGCTRDWDWHKSVGARLAGDDDLADAIAGKPDSYRDRGVRGIEIGTHP